MLVNFVKGVLISSGGFLILPLVIETGKLWPVVGVGFALVTGFLWALWRFVILCRARAYRTAEDWKRESFALMGGVVVATPVLAVLLDSAMRVRPPDERAIAKVLLELALNQYHKDVGTYPANLDALIANPGVARWAGPYIEARYTRYLAFFDYSVGIGGKPILIVRPRDHLIE